jgi:hypothetical protein
VRTLPLFLLTLAAAATAQYRPPAVPLVAHDPYFSVWSTSDRLNEGVTRHWTGAEHPLTSLIRIDGKTFRLMGEKPADVPPLPQTTVAVKPTRTVYTFANDQVEVKLTFTTPALPNDIDVLSRPATYITWQVRALDRKTHEVSAYLDASSLLAVNKGDQEVVWKREKLKDTTVLRIGSKDQQILGKAGDNLRIDWGYLYLAASKSTGALNNFSITTESFKFTGSVPATDARAVSFTADSNLVAAVAVSLGRVGANPIGRHAILAYDDLYSIQYFGQNLRPYWRRNGQGAIDLLRSAERDYDKLTKACVAFDEGLTNDLRTAGGEDYAYLGSLAYRQSFAAQKVVGDKTGQPLMFSKENFSNGCIATVDVLYPAAPQLLLLSPTLTKASLAPVLEYAASARWKWPFAPHDLGTYPKANGQVYGGGERTEENQMPVEESGNMLILLAALAKVEGNSNFAGRYWPELERWAQYLADKGFDPESQLSTDDFAGHLAHNVNLSAKAIVALRAFAYLCELRSKSTFGRVSLDGPHPNDLKALAEMSKRYKQLAESYAARWIKEANDGDHYRLAFDRPGTWSQKYNLVWDRLLGFNLFPSSVVRTELDFYLRHQNAFGLPLDNRRDYTKLDWILWSATLTGRRSDFDALVRPVISFLNETPDRVPMTDWFHTLSPRKSGFQARSVVGGVFIKLLESQATWRKYTARDRMKIGNYSAVPRPPVITEILPTAQLQPTTWTYTTSQPDNRWFVRSFEPVGWRTGPSGFGTSETPGTAVRTTWNTPDIWLRKEFDVKDPAGLKLYIHHDESAEVYLNGKLVAQLSGYTTQYELVDIKGLQRGRNVLAIHCHQTSGGQYIDAGLVRVR